MPQIFYYQDLNSQYHLLNNSIEKTRLIAKGYGEIKPVETNLTDEGRAINRRVEFTILKK